jgi:hypothetical protein
VSFTFFYPLLIAHSSLLQSSPESPLTFLYHLCMLVPFLEPL